MSIEAAKKILGEAPDDIPEIYYYPVKDKYWIKNGRGQFAGHKFWHVRARLKEQRLNDLEINQLLLAIQKDHDVDFVSEVAGWSQGVHEDGGRRILVPAEQYRIPPKQGEWPTVRKVLLGMFGEDQSEWFLGWLQQWVKAYYDYAWMPGQVVLLVGPTVAGKSLLQTFLSYLFGDCEADPLPWMTGKSDFNGELVGVPHLKIEDKFAESTKAVKDALRENAKAIAVNKSHRIRKMYQDAFTACPLWRATFSCNPTFESMSVAPPVDEHTKNKISLLWCSRTTMPMPTNTHKEQEVFFQQLRSEAPALIYYLLKEHAVSEDMECPEKRMGVRGYHHPKALAAAENSSFEGQRMESIREALQRWQKDNGKNKGFGAASTKDGGRLWQGTPTGLKAVLDGRGLANDFKTAGSLGRLLANRSRLKGQGVTRHPDRTYSIEYDDELGAQVS